MHSRFSFSVGTEQARDAHLSLQHALPTRRRYCGGLQFPLATARHSSAPVKEIRVTAEIEGQSELMNIYSPTVEIKTTYRGDKNALVTYTSRDFYPSADFVVYYREDNTEVGASFLTYFLNAEKTVTT